jgi:hypothetical protein
VLIMKELHDRLDTAVADTDDWPADLTDDEILAKLVAPFVLEMAWRPAIPASGSTIAFGEVEKTGKLNQSGPQPSTFAHQTLRNKSVGD